MGNQPWQQGPGLVVEGYARWALEAAQAIQDKAAQLGPSLGERSGDLQHAGGASFYQAFQVGRVYWHPDAGAHWVLGAILDRYLEFGGPAGWMGSPVADEMPGADGVGRFSHFQNAAICWHPACGAFEVHGDIRAAWERLGGTAWGYPSTDELPTAAGDGRFTHFRPEGAGPERSIHWSPGTGAHATMGPIRDRWAALGWETGYLGYPIDEALPLVAGVPGGVQHFQRGRIETLTLPGIAVEATRDVPAVVEKSVELSSGGVRAAVRLALASNGHYAFSGSFENDSVISLTATVAVAPKFATPSGVVLVATEEHDLAGELTPGSESHVWNHGAHEPKIQEFWGELIEAPIEARLSTDVGVGDVINLVLSALPAVAIAGAAILLVGGSHEAVPHCGPDYMGPNGPEKDCGIEIVPKH